MLDLLGYFDVIDLLYQLSKNLRVFHLLGHFLESPKSISWVVASSPQVLHRFLAPLADPPINFFPRQHADVGTHSEVILFRHGVTMESSTVKENEVSCFCVDLLIVAQRLLHFFNFWHFVPVSLMLGEASILKVFLME